MGALFLHGVGDITRLFFFRLLQDYQYLSQLSVAFKHVSTNKIPLVVLMILHRVLLLFLPVVLALRCFHVFCLALAYSKSM